MRSASLQSCFVIGAEPGSLTNFRGDLIRALVREGVAVTALSAPQSPEQQDAIAALGATPMSYPVARTGLNPKGDLKTFRNLRALMRHKRPDAVLAYTIKPVIWGGLAARALPKCRFYALITGLGFAFQGQGAVRRGLTHLVSGLYRSALTRADKVIFQNADNRDEFIARGIVRADKCAVVSGSGVDTAKFAVAAMPAGAPVFLVIARLLGEKGLREYAAAAAMVRRRFSDAQFHLVGPPDPSPDGITLGEVEGWQASGAIVYHGATKDVRPYISNCHIYVLPSYHEGMPRTVLEALAMGRPVLTTDVPGCRETVRNGVNGHLVPKENAEALAERMIWFLEHRDQWAAMAAASRELATQVFDVHKINDDLLRIMGVTQAHAS